jgi:hypothetical protein
MDGKSDSKFAQRVSDTQPEPHRKVLFLREAADLDDVGQGQDILGENL